MWCGLRKHMPLGDICITSPADVQFNCNLRNKLKLFPAANIQTHASLANSFFFHATHSERKVQYHFLFKHPIPLAASSAITSTSVSWFCCRPQGKVMFSQVFVCQQSASCYWLTVRPSYSVYGSYWNAFLLYNKLCVILWLIKTFY